MSPIIDKNFSRDQKSRPSPQPMNIRVSEDKHVLRDDLGKVWTVLTNVALSLCRLLSSGERTLREVRKKCNADPCDVAERLGFDP